MSKSEELESEPEPQELFYKTLEGGTGRLGINLFLPAAPAKATVVYAHGGGFSHGSRHDKTATRLAEILRHENVAVASIDYRKRAEIGVWPPHLAKHILDSQDRTRRVGLRVNPQYCGPAFYAALEDYSEALQYLRNNAANFGLGSRFVALGASAGGIAALSLAYPPRGHWDKLCRPDAAMGICAAMVQPWRLHKDGPPCVLMHGYHDGVISPHNAKVIARKSASKAAPIQVEITQVRGHRAQVEAFLSGTDQNDCPYMDLLRTLIDASLAKSAHLARVNIVRSTTQP